MSTAGLDLRGVARRFGRRWVLRGLDIQVEPGHVIAVTGRNGCGKTTLLRICSTLLRPTRGGGTVFGYDLVQDANEIRELLGMLAHDAGLYPNLTAFENLEFSVRMAGLHTDRPALERALSEVGLSRERNERVGGFSAGMRRRLALARLLLRPPKLLLLDEPYASFDVDGIDLVNDFAAAVAGTGGIVLIATHDLARAEPIMHREARIEGGRIIDQAGPERLGLVGVADGEAT